MDDKKEFDPETEDGQKFIEQEYNKFFQAPKYQMAEIEKRINRGWLYIIIISSVLIAAIYYLIRP